MACNNVLGEHNGNLSCLHCYHCRELDDAITSLFSCRRSWPRREDGVFEMGTAIRVSLLV